MRKDDEKQPAECKPVSDPPHEKVKSFREPMTPQDKAEAAAFLRRFREWERAMERWKAYWLYGAAPYWVGPRPPRQRPTPPLAPTITNTACQKAAQVGVQRIYRELERELRAVFRCSDVGCSGGRRCLPKFSREKGDGYSLEHQETFCIYTVRGTCECDFDVAP